MRLYESIQNNLKESEASREDLKNLYYMDRVLRCMNDEDALSDGWLMNYVADGDSDHGIDYIVDNYSWMSKEDINDAYEYYKKLVASTLEDGIIAREFYKGSTWFKQNAGANRAEIAFVKKDFPDIKIITK